MVKGIKSCSSMIIPCSLFVEKFIGIMLITLLLSCEMEEQVEQKIGKVSFETNQDIMNSSFDIDIYVDQKKLGSLNNNSDFPETGTNTTFKLKKNWKQVYILMRLKYTHITESPANQSKENSL